MDNQIRLYLDTQPTIQQMDILTSGVAFLHPDRVTGYHVLLMILHGQMQVVEEGEAFLLLPGDFFFLKSGLHHWGTEPVPIGTRWAYAHFCSEPSDPNYLYNPYKVVSGRMGKDTSDERQYLLLPKQGKVSEIDQLERFRLMTQLYHSDRPLCMPMAAAQLMSYLLELSAAEQGRLLTSRGERLSQQLIAFLREYARQSLSAETIAAHMNMNYRYLCRVFRSATGASIQEYHLALRMEEACRMMRDTAYNVSEIAQLVGYADPLYFSHVFKHVKGVSPSAYMRQTYRQSAAKQQQQRDTLV